MEENGGEERREERGKTGVRGPRAFAIWSSFDCSPLDARGLGAYLLLPTTNGEATGPRIEFILIVSPTALHMGPQDRLWRYSPG